eukprot:GHVU01170454.1.p1 GENE.GHVU01170454.1~~GHVU01170454.1.p1  ORF type:complete len:166 (-),score=4.87 GHVU01170454.1:138-635(-)
MHLHTRLVYVYPHTRIYTIGSTCVHSITHQRLSWKFRCIKMAVCASVPIAYLFRVTIGSGHELTLEITCSVVPVVVCLALPAEMSTESTTTITTVVVTVITTVSTTISPYHSFYHDLIHHQTNIPVTYYLLLLSLLLLLSSSPPTNRGPLYSVMNMYAYTHTYTH